MILTVNVGSSNTKLALFDVDGDSTPRASTIVARGEAWPPEFIAPARPPVAVVHRVVHGGAEYAAPMRITDDVLAGLERLQMLAPEHMPGALAAVRRAMAAFPHAIHVACFDTAFHRTMPPVAEMYPLPRRFRDAGIRRYGFHGLSCESILESLGRLDPSAARGRVIVAHLGGGSSLTAIRAGRSVDTTMGFSPAGGLMMARRTGDLDPGVLIHLIEQERLDAAGLRALVSHESGLAGVSGGQADMARLLASETDDSLAADAIELYVYLAKKALGGLIAVLGGVDTIVFTGGIGEHAATVRGRILGNGEVFGFQIDPDRNRRHAAVISRDEAPVTVRVIAAAEDRVLARHARGFLTTRTP